ncbi:peptide/nickel transport system permease protein [Mycobacterium sp. BK558]|uniref:Putative D,D-dipeptide transport system permease protein DdpC n=2 Tax=Mycolicibacterium TaxID=1866885 RepID=A0A0J6WEL8_MYCCU|nr:MULTISPECIES: ABC transporter permease [Mycolicibacterium]MBI5339764.1 ABC transporter permease [Mycolicibacterium rufum]RZT19377.1 peptide/nickel transport system permease protein [Mycobacterium sp. BK558]KMO78644.1 putative D,D-dipeptide transport system permease protein DdpC [Mycolicibacterium chlorophenolicum]KMO80959.1 putative D,D-dipeptide transport system permease protein DdpC [Mycolicibacterium chubuense]ORA47311.1 ABC transporter permease [Mycolicibacterium chubuense]
MAVALPASGLIRGRQRRLLTLPGSNSTLLNGIGFATILVVTAVVIAVPVLAPHDPLLPVGVPLQAPGKNGFLLGTDSIGRDILSRVLYGARSSWFAALVVVAVGLFIGGLVGVIAGATGGWVDTVLMRITDAFLSLPAPVLAIAVVAALGPGFVHTLIAVSIVWWPFYARLVRGEIARLAARPHVEAAKLAGVGPWRLARRHLVPGAVPNALVAASLDIGTLILTLASLSFLGLGQAAPAPELGADSARNLSYFLQQWWIPVMPGLGVLVLALVGNIAGDCLRNLMKGRA